MLFDTDGLPQQSRVDPTGSDAPVPQLLSSLGSVGFLGGRKFVDGSDAPVEPEAAGRREGFVIIGGQPYQCVGALFG